MSNRIIRGLEYAVNDAVSYTQDLEENIEVLVKTIKAKDEEIEKLEGKIEELLEVINELEKQI